MIVTIDGPAGAGKSHVAWALAKKLSFRFLDTGAMYRAVALAALRRNLNWDDSQALAELARSISIRFDGQRVLLDGADVTDEIRSTAVTEVIHHVADQLQVRARLVELQREIAAAGDYVTEGRDQGTVAFPEADYKFFITASREERARRRVRDLKERGEDASFDDVLAQQDDRDRRDAARPVGRLEQAADAVEIVTDNMTPDEVVEDLHRRVRAKQNAR